MMIYVRCDGNNKIGMGHMIRCMGIASQIVRMGEKITFFVADDTSAEVVKNAGFVYEVLHTDYQKMEEELLAIKRIVEKDAKFLVDSYYVTNTYFDKLRDLGPVFYVDDVAKFDYRVDGVINGNIYGDEVVYSCEMALLGYDYALVREEFTKARKCVNPTNLLITTGGSDPYFLAEKLLKSLLSDDILSAMDIDVVCGKFSESYESLMEMTKEKDNITIHKDVRDMWRLMQRAKVAITAGGTTMTELCAMGVPMVCFSFVDNQDRIVESFVKKGYTLYGGFYKNLKDDMIEKLLNAAKSLATNEDLRQEYVKKLSRLVDGKGCERIAKSLIEYER